MKGFRAAYRLTPPAVSVVVCRVTIVHVQCNMYVCILYYLVYLYLYMHEGMMCVVKEVNNQRSLEFACGI